MVPNRNARPRTGSPVIDRPMQRTAWLGIADICNGRESLVID